MQTAGLHIESQTQPSPLESEVIRRLFWSVHVLSQIYGQRRPTVILREHVQLPRYEYISANSESTSETPPHLPNEAMFNEETTQVCGIWGYAVQMTSLWKEIRDYLALWKDGAVPVKPWSHTSQYATISSRLMDIETGFPSQHRYDSAKFWEQSSDELETNRDYWCPWLLIQFTYHAIHTVLNHPFLYSARPNENPDFVVPNSFWKTLSEAALTHSTWTIRLLDQLREKNFHVHDQFVGHCVSIAATVHLYYCRPEDQELRQTVQQRLQKCLGFLLIMGNSTSFGRVMVSPVFVDGMLCRDCD